MPAKQSINPAKPSLDDKGLFMASPFLADLVGQGTWRETDREQTFADIPGEDEDLNQPSFKEFRREFRKTIHDPEEAVLSLRQLRVRTLLALAKADLEDPGPGGLVGG